MEPKMTECRKVSGDLHISVKDGMIDMECRMDFEAEYGYSKSDQCIIQDFAYMLDNDIKFYSWHCNQLLIGKLKKLRKKLRKILRSMIYFIVVGGAL